MTHYPYYRRILHRMGYYDYQRGLIVNHIAQDNGWLRHQKHCRDFILKAVDVIAPEKVTVLGSGWLLELPLLEMSERVGEIRLVDIIHPPEVIVQTREIRNIKLIEDDITGGLIEEVWKKAGNRTFFNKLPSIGQIKIPEYNAGNPGLIISLMVLTQLESLPVRLLEKKAKKDENALLNFRKNIQVNHISCLKQHKAVLITDTSEIFIDPDGKSTEVRTLLTDLPQNCYTETWRWDLDLKRADFNRKRSVMEITGVIF